MSIFSGLFKLKQSSTESVESSDTAESDSEDHALIYAIGDVHGQLTMLRALLDQIRDAPLRDEDIILFLGDYIDRGEDSRGVIEELLQLQRERPNTIFLRGNHESLLLSARESEPSRISPTSGKLQVSDELLLWLQNGGELALESYDEDYEDEDLLEWWTMIPDSHWDFFNSTQFEYVTPRYHFVHAGLLPPGETWDGADRDMDVRLWIREPFLSSRHDFGKVVVFGHTPMKEPVIQPNKIGLDTGAVFGGMLTAAAFDPLFSQRVNARKIPPPRLFQVDYEMHDFTADILSASG